jgi:predicted AlkP superfamily phosphohydrolase/phosphomutase
MTRTLMIGLDGATFTLLDPLMQDGVMPALRKIVESGVRGELLSGCNFMTAQAVPTMMTGRTPGNHGMFDFVSFEETETGGSFHLTSSRDLRCETIWSIASRQGRRVTALNFYGTYPPERVNGHMIGGFVPWRYLKSATHPPELYQRLRSLPGLDWRELGMDLELEKKCIQGLPHAEYKDWIRMHMRRERNWFKILHHLMEEQPSELTAIWIDGVDKLQHLCWRFLDKACFPEHHSVWEAEIRDLCLDYYRQLDNFISETVTRAGPDTRIYLKSDHGFGKTDRIFYVNTWLAKHGYLTWAKDTTSDERDQLTADRMKQHFGLFDWKRTTAYALTPSSNGIFIRKKSSGWDKPGAIDPADYNAFREQLRKELLSERDQETGDPVVSRVLTREEAYPGACMHMAPDLFLTLPDRGFFSVLKSGTILKRRAEIVGTHRPEGIFIAAGPGLEQNSSLPPLSITDVAPILLHSLGLSVPADMEGQVPAGIFCGHAGDHAVRRSSPETAAAGSDLSGARDEDEDDMEAAIIEHLKGLGYLELPPSSRTRAHSDD